MPLMVMQGIASFVLGYGLLAMAPTPTTSQWLALVVLAVCSVGTFFTVRFVAHYWLKGERKDRPPPAALRVVRPGLGADDDDSMALSDVES